jgi:hypothetical protein
VVDYLKWAGVPRMVAKSVAADVISSGAAITYDMAVHLIASPWLSLARRCSTRQNNQDFKRFHCFSPERSSAAALPP